MMGRRTGPFGFGFAAATLLVAATVAMAQAPVPAPPAVPVPQSLNNPTVPTAPASTPQNANAVLDTPAAEPAVDKSALSSPVPASPSGQALRIGTAVSVRMSDAVNSGVQRNGDIVHGVLAASVKTSAGLTVPSGAKVDATVVSAARAGTMLSGGVLSLQLTRIGGVPVITDVVDFNGKEGHKDVADSAPAKGSEAVVQPGAILQFHVMENGRATGLDPGAVDGKGGGVKQYGVSAAPGSGSLNPATQGAQKPPEFPL